jgi:hypothetical protein
MNTLRGLYRGLEAMNGADSGVDPADYLVAVDHPSDQQELVLVREAEDGAVEIALALANTRPSTASRPAPAPSPTPPSPTPCRSSRASATSSISSRPSAASARSAASSSRPRPRSTSSPCACSTAGPPPDDYARLVDRLFCQWHPVGPLRERYTNANRIALGFSRCLSPLVRDGRLGPCAWPCAASGPPT